MDHALWEIVRGINGLNDKVAELTKTLKATNKTLKTTDKKGDK